jgi:hypothetical protein
MTVLDWLTLIDGVACFSIGFGITFFDQYWGTYADEEDIPYKGQVH